MTGVKGVQTLLNLSSRDNRLSAIALLLILCAANSAFAAKASLILHPTQLFISEDDRNQSIRVINNGDATGVFEVSWVDYAMKPDGGFEEWTQEGFADWSLQDKVRYSPRRVTLAPGESQNIKIMIQRKATPPSAEYYSHLKVIIATANLDAEQEEELTPNATSVEVKTRSGISVPVIWRNPDVAPKATISNASMDWTAHKLTMNIVRQSGVSTRGYLHVLVGGQNKSVVEPIHTVIYPSIDHREVSIPLNDVNVKQGDKVTVVYSEELDSTTPELAHFELH